MPLQEAAAIRTGKHKLPVQIIWQRHMNSANIFMILCSRCSHNDSKEAIEDEFTVLYGFLHTGIIKEGNQFLRLHVRNRSCAAL